LRLLPRITIIALYSLERRSRVYGFANWWHKAVSKSSAHILQQVLPPESQRRRDNDPKRRWPNSATPLVEFGQSSTELLGLGRLLSARREYKPLSVRDSQATARQEQENGKFIPPGRR